MICVTGGRGAFDMTGIAASEHHWNVVERCAQSASFDIGEVRLKSE